MVGNMGRYKPYPGYKRSGKDWLGEIPATWRILRLKHITLEPLTYGANEAALETDSKNPRFIRITDINDDGSLSEATFRSLKPEIAEPYLLSSGDILLARSGATVGKSFIYSEDWGTCCFAGYLIKASIDESKALASWVYRFTQTKCYREWIESIQIQATIQNVSAEKYNSFEVAIPPLPEQIQILAFLDHETAKIDDLIAKQQRLIALLEEKRQAVISHAVTKGLNPDAPLRPSGIDWLGDVPAHWEVGYLGYEASIKARLGWKGLKADEYVDDGYIFLATPNIKGDQIDFENVNFITQERYDESPEIALKVGDVLVTKDGSTTGTTNVVRDLPRPATVNSSIAVIRSSGSLASIYLYFWFHSEYTQNVIKRMQDGMGVPHLFQADLRKFRVLLPPATEQYEIVRHLEDVVPELDKLLRKAQSAIILLQERRTALISAAVTGKIDVRDWRLPADRKTSQGKAA